MKNLIQKKFGIFSKFLISFLLISLLPLIFFGILTFNSFQTIGDQIIDETFLMIDVKTQKTLEIQAAIVAKRVESFLRNRENDILTLSKRELDAQEIVDFQKNLQSEIWIREKRNGKIVGAKYYIPIYKEISVVNLKGEEVIKSVDSKLVNLNELKNVSIPGNTTYKSEKYFEKSLSLEEGEIYISRLEGFHLSIREQLGDQKDLENAADKNFFNGVIRITTPIFIDGIKTGILVFGIDHKHFMEFTQHILPNSEEEIVFPSYSSGDYAFIFDDEGWIITHPKFWDIRGNDSAGVLVPPYTKSTPDDMIEEGRIPFNLNYAGFIHENYPVVAKRILNKEIGSVITTNVGGIKKIMAFAPIYYAKGEYNKNGVFGGVTIGAEITKFQNPSIEIKNEIASVLDLVVRNSLLFIIFTFIITVIAAWFISRHFTNPIVKLTTFSQNLAEGELDQFITSTRNDELGLLTESFNTMTNEIKKGRNQLIYSYRDLQESQKDIEKYASSLEYQLKILKSIQSIGNLLGSTFELNSILNYILQTCVDSVNFDRAILYLLNDSGDVLECKGMYGFTDEEQKSAANSKYNINHFHCIETEVVKSGEIIFVEDFETYHKATVTDKKIRKIAKSNSFVFVPLRVKEKNIGILGADKLKTNSKITETDINSLQILANQASRVIENTMLYSEIISQRNFVEDIISNMINGVISTNGNGTITSINKAAKDILNLTDKNIVGKNIWNLLQYDSQLMSKMKEKLASTGIFKGYNIRLVINQETKYLNINASRVYQNNIHTNSIVILEDVTEKKQIDEKIQNIDRLASVGRFAAKIAHEIRNPLTGLSLFLDDLHDNLGSENNNYIPLITSALTEIERLDNLIKEILEYSVPSKGKLVESKVNELIDNILLLINKQLERQKIKVVKSFSKNVKSILLDPERIKQALLNLILNSIQFMPNGGELTISTSIFIDKSKKENLEIIIEDNGEGFKDVEIAKIFDPFYSNREGGTGLGLAITHSIIIEHGGSIYARNRESKGAQIKIILPIKKKKSK